MDEPNPDSSEPISPLPAVCLGCTCLCDDVRVAVERGVLKQSINACRLGVDWFVKGLSQVDRPLPDRSLAKPIATSLRASQSPVFFGLTQSSTETARKVLELADRVRGRVVLNQTLEDRAKAEAFQNVGRVTSTWGEVKNRSDLIIYWGCDPLTSHPRHFERFAVSSGRFVPEGRADRFVIVIDSNRTATADAADFFIELEPALTLDFTIFLRILLQGKPGASEESVCLTSANRELAKTLIEKCRTASYGALVFNHANPSERPSRLVWESILSLVRDLNEVTRFVTLGLGSKVNLAGAEAALAWQTGQLLGVDFRLGYPEALESTTTLNEILESKDVDHLCVVGDCLPTDLSPAARQTLSEIPCSFIASRSARKEGMKLHHDLPSATFGIDSGGSVTRSDGVSLLIQPVVESTNLSESDWIDLILENIDLQEAGGSPQ